MDTRRRLLTAGGGLVPLGLAGLGRRAWDRGVWAAGEGPAYEPWRDWQGAAADGLARPLRAAILAANPHDTQPWLFAVAGETIGVLADRARHLGAFDPFRREMHLGLGAAIENLVLAAGGLGLAAEVEPIAGRLTLSPNTRAVLAARVTLGPGAAVRPPLLAALGRRHTNRGPYRPDQPIAAERLSGLAQAVADPAVRVAFLGAGTGRGELGALIVEATDRIVGDPVMSADSARWFRTGRREIAANRDGVTADAAGLPPLTTAVSKLLPDLDAKTSDSYWLATTRDTQVPTAPVLGVLLVRDRLDMAASLAAGRAWQRLHLAATLAGLAAQPLNQPVEWADREAMLGRPDSYSAAIAKLAGAVGWHPTFVFRLGVAERAARPSPRRALEAVLRR